MCTIAVGWIGREVVKRNGDRRMKIGSVIVYLFSTSTMMSPPSTSAQSEQLQQRWISRVSSLYLGTLGGEKGMRDTRVEWTEFTWLLIS
jgi:hypothetical protein